MTSDVEKRWNDAGMFRRAVWFTVAVVIVALVVMGATILWSVMNDRNECADAYFAVCESPERYIVTMAPTAILLIGGIVAFVRSYRAWRAGGAWPIWQGAGWALFVLMLLYLGISSPALTNT